jgi:GGDEF domain-containing protein
VQAFQIPELTAMPDRIFQLHRNSALSVFPNPESHQNFCTPAQFERQLSREKRRTERLCSQFSVVAVSFKRLAYPPGRRNGVRHQEICRAAGIVCSTLRETDVVSLHGENEVLIMLPDTDTVGARWACERLRARLAHAADSTRQEFSRDICEFVITSYPDGSNPTRGSLKDVGTPGIERGSGSGQAGPLSQDAGREDFWASLIREPQHVRGCRNAAVVGVPGSLAPKPRCTNLFIRDQQKRQRVWLSTQRVLKRGMDIAGAIAGLVLFSPLMAIIAVLIKLTSRGPVLFRQTRLGYEGREFVLLKFRSMQNG